MGLLFDLCMSTLYQWLLVSSLSSAVNFPGSLPTRAKIIANKLATRGEGEGGRLSVGKTISKQMFKVCCDYKELTLTLTFLCTGTTSRRPATSLSAEPCSRKYGTTAPSFPCTRVKSWEKWNEQTKKKKKTRPHVNNPLTCRSRPTSEEMDFYTLTCIFKAKEILIYPQRLFFV